MISLLDYLRTSRPSSPKINRVTGLYEAKRKGLNYYSRSLDTIAQIKEMHGCSSIIDIGGWSGFFIAQTTLEKKTCLDRKVKRTETNTGSVEFVEADFLDYEPTGRFDIVCCMQVLEHIPDELVGVFARKLFAIGDHVVLSVPYKWPQGYARHHCQDPVDEQKLQAWVKRPPTRQYIVVDRRWRRKARGLRRLVPKAEKRMICYYDNRAQVARDGSGNGVRHDP